MGDPELEHGSERPARERPDRPGASFLLLHLLALVVLGICVRTEYLNHAAGGVLPRPTPRGNPKWRAFPWSWEEWRDLGANRPRDAEGRLARRAHSAAELAQLRALWERCRAGEALRRWLRSVCCWHYLLLPSVLAGLLAQARRPLPSPYRLSAVLLAASVGLCAGLTLYRGYSAVYAS